MLCNCGTEFGRLSCKSETHRSKTRFEASRVVFWSLSCYKELKLTTNRFTGTSRPSDPDAKYQLAKFGHAQKAKFRFLGLKVTQQS